MATTNGIDGRQLLQQAEKILLHPIHPHLIAYCPTMDLVALVTDEENLDVYRLNGQRAFGLKRKDDELTVDTIQWQFNGKGIAVSWSDGSTDLVSAETGKVSHKDLTLPSVDSSDAMDGGEPVRVKCIGWGLNFIDIDAVKRRTGWYRKIRKKGNTTGQTDEFGVPISDPTTEDWDDFKDGTTIEDFLQRQPDIQALDIAPDLPDQLAVMDVEAVLPRLPAIPMPPALPFMRVVTASGAFSSQPEVDTLLHSHHLKDHNSVDMLIRCSERGTIHPSIYDSLETVNVRLPTAWNIDSRPLQHTNHPYSCTHSLLMRVTPTGSSQQSKASRIAFVPLTLNFIPSAGIYLHLIAAKTSQLQNLLLYITQTIQRIHAFFKNAQDLPGKFMRNIQETLEEKGQGDLVTNLFHIACTGSCPEAIREWLVDELAEQGHKRWDNTVTSSMTTLLALVHENLIPAIDRCSIVISRLRGLAQFHDQDWIFTAPISDFTALMEVLKNMRLVAHTALLHAGEEKRQFHAFSKWLRFCIDYEATEPESQSRAEMENRDPGVDVGQVLLYIKNGLTKSAMTPYFRPKAQLGARTGNTEPANYDDTKKAIELQKEGASYKEEALCLEHVLECLVSGVTVLLRQVSGWQERNLQMDSGIVLEESEEEQAEAVMHMHMVSEIIPNIPNTMTTYILISPPSNPSHLHIHRLAHTQSITSLPKDLHDYAISTLDFSAAAPSARILDAKFADDSQLLVLLQYPSEAAEGNTSTNQEKKTTTVLLSLTYSPSKFTTNDIIAFPSPDSPSSTSPPPSSPSPYISTFLPSGTPLRSRHTIPVPLSTIQTHTRHIFTGRFTPLKIVVNGRKGRRVVLVLGDDRRHYRVLDLDFAVGKDGKGRRVETGKEWAAGRGGAEGGEESSESGESAGEDEEDADADGDVTMGGE